MVPVKLFVTEYEIRHYYCPSCDKIVYPDVPEVIDNCRFGIMFMLYITYLRYVLNLPYNKMARLLNDTYKARVSEGTLVKYIKRAAELFGGEYERLRGEVRRLGRVHVDETGWRVDGRNQWLWGFIGEKAALYGIDERRSSEVVEETLGEYQGVVVSDCYTAYNPLPYQAQKDWVHLLRDTRELESEEGRRMHRRLKRLLGDAVKAKGAWANADTARFEQGLDAVANEEYREEECVEIAKRLRKHGKDWLTFLAIKEVDHHNNEAERGVRNSVVTRKITGGNRSETGARTHEIAMSIMQTCELRGTDFLNHAQEIISQQLQMGK